MSIIYHIATASDWEQARRDGQYTTSTRGRTLAEQGYVHASTAEQVAPVANMIYKGEPDLPVLVIDADRVRPEIRFEAVPNWLGPIDSHSRWRCIKRDWRLPGVAAMA